MLSSKKETLDFGVQLESIDKAVVVQEFRVFHNTPLKSEECIAAMTKLLYLLNKGEKLSVAEATKIFFAISKAFQSKEVSVKRLLYLLIEELSNTAEDVIMVVSSLCQDVNNCESLRSGALRSLGAVVDFSMLSSIERPIKQSLSDEKSASSSSALILLSRFRSLNREAVRRFLPEIQTLLQVSPSAASSLAQYHALGLLFSLKENDKVAMSRVVINISEKSTNVLTTVLNLRIYSHLLDSDRGSSLVMVDLKSFLRFKGRSDMVALEAARIICRHHDLYFDDLSVAAITLQSFLSSKSPVLRLAALRIVHDLAKVSLESIAMMNNDIETLVTDSNRNIASLAVTILLKSGNEASVDRLAAQVVGYLSEISDEFKVIVVQAISELARKFPAKSRVLLQLLGDILKDDGGFSFKTATVDAIIFIVGKRVELADEAILYLCDFIEDCEYPLLTSKILFVIGEYGCHCRNPAALIRFIYNRLILENALVRRSAIDALTALASTTESTVESACSILKLSLADLDDEVRDRAALGISLLQGCSYQPTYFEVDSLEKHLLSSRNNEMALQDFASVPVLDVPQSPGMRYTDQTLFADEVFDRSHNKLTSRHPALEVAGEELKTSNRIILTNADNEYSVTLIKHVFLDHIILEFEIYNSLAEIVCRQVKIVVDSDQVANSTVIDTLEPESKSSVFVTLKMVEPYNLHVIAATLHLVAYERTASAGIVDQICLKDNIEVGIRDFIIPHQVLDPARQWTEGNDAETVETMELSNFTLESAYSAIESVYGLRALDRKVSGQIFSFYIFGQLFGDFPESRCNFALKIRLVGQPGGVIAEVSVRSPILHCSELILGALC